MFNRALYEKQVAASWLSHHFYFFEELPSTNSYAKQMNGDKVRHGSLILTDYQTGGRGQYDRKWRVEPGQNLTFSLIFEPQKTDRFNLLTLACVLAISEVLNEELGINTRLKWPNDILLNQKKICGILTETQFSGNKLEQVVVGIGLNVNQLNFPGELKSKATSLRKECGKELSRETLLAAIVQRIEYRYRQWNQYNRELVKEINRALIGFGEWIQLEVNDEVLEGEYKFLGVNETGILIALNKKLDIISFSHEQVRVQF